MINLRSASNSTTTPSSFQPSHFSVPSFRVPNSVLSNIGESLHESEHGSNGQEEDELETGAEVGVTAGPGDLAIGVASEERTAEDTSLEVMPVASTSLV